MTFLLNIFFRNNKTQSRQKLKSKQKQLQEYNLTSFSSRLKNKRKTFDLISDYKVTYAITNLKDFMIIYLTKHQFITCTVENTGKMKCIFSHKILSIRKTKGYFAYKNIIHIEHFYNLYKIREVYIHI